MNNKNLSFFSEMSLSNFPSMRNDKEHNRTQESFSMDHNNKFLKIYFEKKIIKEKDESLSDFSFSIDDFKPDEYQAEEKDENDIIQEVFYDEQEEDFEEESSLSVEQNIETTQNNDEILNHVNEIFQSVNNNSVEEQNYINEQESKNIRSSKINKDLDFTHKNTQQRRAWIDFSETLNKIIE
jgi:hypothetical protein